MKREQERLNVCAMKDISNEYIENKNVVELKDIIRMNKEQYDIKNSFSLILESKNVDILKFVLFNFVENVRNRCVGVVQCFEYEYLRRKKEVVLNVYDSRFKNRF